MPLCKNNKKSKTNVTGASEWGIHVNAEGNGLNDGDGDGPAEVKGALNHIMPEEMKASPENRKEKQGVF